MGQSAVSGPLAELSQNDEPQTGTLTVILKIARSLGPTKTSPASFETTTPLATLFHWKSSTPAPAWTMPIMSTSGSQADGIQRPTHQHPRRPERRHQLGYLHHRQQILPRIRDLRFVSLAVAGADVLCDQRVGGSAFQRSKMGWSESDGMRAAMGSLLRTTWRVGVSASGSGLGAG